MKKGDFLAFSFFKKSRWMSVVIALIFLLNTCAPAWAREGNYGPSTSLGSFASGVLAGAVTFVSCYIDPTAGAAGSVAGDLTGLFLFYYSYNDYGKTWIKIGKMEISKGQVCSMVAGIVASVAASYASGAISGAGSAAGESGSEAAEGAAQAAGSTAGATAGATAEATAESVASGTSQGLISSVISSAIQLPVDIIKSIVNFFSDLFSAAIDQAFENLFVSLGDAFATFGETIAMGFWTTCKDIWGFVTDPVGTIKDMWKGITRKGGATANPYYRYGTEGAVDKALVHMGGDLGVGMIRMISSEYVKQNLEEGIYIGGKKIIGPVDETIAGMVGSMVSNYVGASMNVMVMKSLGEAFGWDVDAQAGFLSRGEVNPNATITVKVGDKEEDITVSELAGDSKLMNDVKNSNTLKGNTYAIKLNNGKTVQVTGDDILNNSGIVGQLQGFNKGVDYRQEMTKSGSEIVASGNTNRQETKNITNNDLSSYGLRTDGKVLSSADAKDGALKTVEMADGSVITIDLNKSTVNSNGQYTLAIVNRQVNVSAQNFSNSGVTGNRTGKFAVRLNDNSTVTVTIDSENSAKIQGAVNKYNTAMQGYAQTFGQYGALVMADPNRSIRVQVMDDKGNVSSRNISIGELSSNDQIMAFSSKDKVVPEGLYEVLLNDGSKINITAKSLNTQVLGELKSYSVMLNSTYYSQLFKMTGGLMYTINGEDMNTKGVFRSGYEAVRNMGFAPVISTATRIALLEVMDYHTHYGVNKGRIYENLWKMALANAGANLATEAFNNIDSLRETTYGLNPGNNPFQTKGSKSYLAHMAGKTLEESAGALSQIAWGYYCKKNNLNATALNEMAHLAGTTLVAGSIDALFRQDQGLAKTIENGEAVDKEVSQTDPVLRSRLGWENVGGSSIRFTKGVIGDAKNQFVEAALDTALVPYPLRSPGTGPNAFMNQWTVHDKAIQQVSAIAQGSSPIDADLMRLAPNLTYRSDSNVAQSFASAITNRFMPADFRSYALFDNNGIMDYQVNRSLIQGIDIGNNPNLKAALKNYVVKLKEDAAQDRTEGRINAAVDKEERVLQLDLAIDQGVSSAVKSTYRGSRAGVAQDQFSYGNAIIADAVLGGIAKEIKNSSFTLSEAKDRMPFIYKAIKPNDNEQDDLPGPVKIKKDIFDVGAMMDNIIYGYDTRFDTLVGQLSEGVKRYAPNTTLLDYATVDQFGRLQNTYYYGSEYNGSGWEGVKLDKYTQHFYGPFGHQLSVTVDSTNLKPREKIAVFSQAWEKDVVVGIIPGTVEKKINLENFKYLGKEYYKEQGQKIVDALALPEAEQKEALSKLGIITMNADDIKVKIETFLKDNPDKLKEINSLMRRSWHYMGCNTTKSVSAKGLATAEWNLVIMMMIMEGVTSDKDHKSWDQLTSDEQMHIYINSTNFSRYLTDVGYRMNGAKPQGSAIRDSKTGQLLNTTVDCPECDGSKDRYKETPKTIFLPGYFSATPGKNIMGKEKQESTLIGHEDGAIRGPNYSYDLSLYPAGSGFSPYSGPSFNVNAYEINSGPQLIARGVNQIQGTQAAEYRRFEGKSASGISAFSDQSALPKWSVDTGYETDGSLNSAQVKDYSYDADKISREIGQKVDLESRKGNTLQAKLLAAVQLHKIKDITGKEFTFVSGNNEDPNYYHAFYNTYNEVSEKPAVVDNKKDLVKVDSNTTNSKTDMTKAKPLGNLLPEIVVTAKSEERQIKPLGLESIPEKKKISETATDTDRYAIEKGILKTARDNKVLFKDQEKLEKQFGVQPPEDVAKEAISVPSDVTNTNQSMLLNKNDNPALFLGVESSVSRDNTSAVTKPGSKIEKLDRKESEGIKPAGLELIPENKKISETSTGTDRYAIEKGILQTARNTGVLFKDQEALEQKYGVQPPKEVVQQEVAPVQETANNQSMLINKNSNPLSFVLDNSGSSIAIDNGDKKTIQVSPETIKTDKTSTLDNNKLPVVKAPLISSTNIGTDAVFLKSDFQADAVTTSSVTNNPLYTKALESHNATPQGTATTLDKYAIEKEKLKMARDTGVLFKNQEALEQKYGVQPPKDAVKKETTETAPNNIPTILLNKETNPLFMQEDNNTTQPKKETKIKATKDGYMLPEVEITAKSEATKIEPKGLDYLPEKPQQITKNELKTLAPVLIDAKKEEVNISDRLVTKSAVLPAVSEEKSLIQSQSGPKDATKVILQNPALADTAIAKDGDLTPFDTKVQNLIDNKDPEIEVTLREVLYSFYGKDKAEENIRNSPAIKAEMLDQKFKVNTEGTLFDQDENKKTMGGYTISDAGATNEDGTRKSVIHLNRELMLKGEDIFGRKYDPLEHAKQAISHEVQHQIYNEVTFANESAGKADPATIEATKQLLGELGKADSTNSWLAANKDVKTLAKNYLESSTNIRPYFTGIIPDKANDEEFKQAVNDFKWEIFSSLNNAESPELRKDINFKELYGHLNGFFEYLAQPTELNARVIEGVRIYGKKPQNREEFNQMTEAWKTSSRTGDFYKYGGAAEIIQGLDEIDRSIQAAYGDEINPRNDAFIQKATQFKDNLLNFMFKSTQDYTNNLEQRSLTPTAVPYQPYVNNPSQKAVEHIS